MYNYFLTENAKEDLLRIYQFGISRFGLNQADKYFNEIHDCFDKIEAEPFMFPTASRFKVGYRSCVCGVDTIFYRIISDDLIEIVSIIGRQEY